MLKPLWKNFEDDKITIKEWSKYIRRAQLKYLDWEKLNMKEAMGFKWELVGQS